MAGAHAATTRLTETDQQQISQNDPKDISLMSRIRDRWGARLVWACAGTAIPAALLAAFVASESGGNPNATNLEESILAMFQNIIEGRAVRWKPLMQVQLKRLTEEQRVQYATSYGLTQITGYHVYPRDPRELLDPDTSLRETVVLLEAWLRHYALDPKQQAAELFHCWNGGGPHNRTVPGYVEHGLEHMKTYELLCGGGSAAGPQEAAERLPATTPAMHAEPEGDENAVPPRPASPSASLENSKQEAEGSGQEGKA